MTTRGLPTVFATRSGKLLGERVILELNRILASKEADPGLHRQRLEDIRKKNRIFFGNDGDFRLRHANVQNFGDGEIHFVVEDYLLPNGRQVTNSVRGQDVFVIHAALEPEISADELVTALGLSPTPQQIKEVLLNVRSERSVHDNFMEVSCACFSLKNLEADRVTLLCPYHIYARQDHSVAREAIIAKLIAQQVHAAGVNHCFYAELHSDQIPGFYQKAPNNLRASALLLTAMKKEVTELIREQAYHQLVVVSPDAGGTKRARYFARQIHPEVDVAIGDKRRNYDKHNTIESVKVVGVVRDRIAFIVDDMIDTAGSMAEVVNAVMEQGAAAIYLVCTHAILSGPALRRLDALFNEGKFQKLITTDSISRDAAFVRKHPWYQQVSLAPLLAEAIFQSTMESSVSNVYAGAGQVNLVHFE